MHCTASGLGHYGHQGCLWLLAWALTRLAGAASLGFIVMRSLKASGKRRCNVGISEDERASGDYVQQQNKLTSRGDIQVAPQEGLCKPNYKSKPTLGPAEVGSAGLPLTKCHSAHAKDTDGVIGKVCLG